MADASRFKLPDPPDAPRTWGEAFAALPAEAPDASRWPALAQAAARRAARTRRRRIGLALAAGVCALALLPFALRRHDVSPDTPATVSVAAVTPSATVRDATPVVPAPQTVATPIDAPPPATTAPRIAQVARPTPRATTRRPHVTRHGDRDAAPVAADGGSRTPLDALYATSAQLETLLALARDTRVDSGPAAALAGDYDAELAAIDAQLALPDLPASEQLRLWQARVDTLQQAAGLESQLRALAASGGRLDGALVTID